MYLLHRGVLMSYRSSRSSTSRAGSRTGTAAAVLAGLLHATLPGWGWLAVPHGLLLQEQGSYPGGRTRGAAAASSGQMARPGGRERPDSATERHKVKHDCRFALCLSQ